MSCFSNFITIDRTTPSTSGLYVVDLPGVTVAQLDGVTKDDQVDDGELFDNIYTNAQINLKIDVQRKLAERFHIDKKLATRETSSFLDEVNTNSGLAGVKITFALPKYARLTILSIGVYSEQVNESPQAQFFVYKEGEDGELLSTIAADLAVGRNTIPVNEFFEENEIYVAYDTDSLALRKTENKYYPDGTYLANASCLFPCAYGLGAGVQQINEGGLNVKFVVHCSMEKLICDNLNLFQYALWYRIGVDLMKERKVSDRVTRFTVLSPERAVELMEVFNEDYQAALNAATMNIKMQEDPICFLCKKPIQAITSLP